MAKKACKCKETECEECPEWIFTLADLIMCMMGLFVILWVLKQSGTPNPPPGKDENLNRMVGAIREAFGYIPDPNSNDPVDMQMIFDRIRALNGPGEKGKMKIESKGAQGTDQEVTTVRLGSQAIVGGRILFEKGLTKLDRIDTNALDEIVTQIRGHRNIVMVKGHTSLDDFPDKTTPEQKMDLSLRRAQLVADYLTSKGVSPDILRVQGCSTFEPVQQRAYTPDMQAVNRRVEVEATSTLVEDFQDRSKPAPTTFNTPNESR
jgi:outer membrane protein OmpA-like peptidoglycan-associated protein